MTTMTCPKGTEQCNKMDYALKSRMKPKISITNTKLHDTFLWSIPPISTCPGATALCKELCYALKAYRQYPTTKAAWNHNEELAKSGDLVEAVTEYLEAELSSKRKTAQFKHFRIHQSGDFFNQNYLNEWIEIAKRFPSIKFLAYTKSSWLDFSQRPKNMIVLFSEWSDTNPKFREKAVAQGLKIARMSDVEGRDVKTFDCKPESKCASCRVCWAGKTDIQFHLH